MNWTNLGLELPWLRGRSVHLASQNTQQLIAETAEAGGYTVLRGTADRRGIGSALRLPATAGTNLDALADALRDLPSYWPGCSRVALLAPEAQPLIRSDLLGWIQLWQLLEQAGDDLWEQEQLVFETVFFVPPGWFGADAP